MRISDWSSDVCSSDLFLLALKWRKWRVSQRCDQAWTMPRMSLSFMISRSSPSTLTSVPDHLPNRILSPALTSCGVTLPSSALAPAPAATTSPSCGFSRSEEHTSELQSLMRISYAVFCLKKKNKLITKKGKTIPCTTHTVGQHTE